ncbi:MAG TPA: BlaI/MecI/CopY family transcriptional regulator [Phycisphaerae bacterium]|nr:BlaI/MecI/CopY family transcriptional regulator [Phycisphaerae bacterium]
MSRDKGRDKARPSDLELQVLSVLWEAGEATVRQIRRDLPDGKPRAYTTVLSVLQGMERKGLVGHSRRGMAYVYHPAVQRRKVLGPMLRELTANLFGGRPARVMQMLLDDAEISDGDRREIRRLLGELDDRS